MNHQSQKTKLRSILLALSFLAFSCVAMVHAQPWEQTHKLLTTDRDFSDNFGSSIALSGNLMVIGAPGDGDNGTNSGSAYVFDVTTGNQLFKLLPSDGAAKDIFGVSVAISGNLAVIGAWLDDDNGAGSGSAYVFDVTTGNQLFKLLPSDGATNDQFGGSIALSGNLAVIGAKGADGNGRDFGSAYVFDVTTGQQLFKLLPSDGAIDDHFGNSVAVGGNLAVIGAPNKNIFSGLAYVFQQRSTNFLTVTPQPLIGGQDGIFTIVQTLPNEKTWLLYSLKGLGQTFIPKLNVTIDLKKPKIVTGPRLTDGNGDLQLVLPIPNIQNPINIWFQTVQQRNVTNFVATQLIP